MSSSSGDIQACFIYELMSNSLNIYPHKTIKLAALRNEQWTIELSKLCYILSEKNICKAFYLCDLSPHELQSKYLNTMIGQLENLLSSKGFYRSHKSYLVNLSHLKPYGFYPGKTLTLHNNMIIPLSRRRKQDFHKRYIEYTKV
jgi:hypothetical protein